MAQCKETAQEFTQNAFSPMVAVLCSHDAERLCQKNNLSFVELVHPFCRLNTEAHIRDPGNIPHTIQGLRVTLRDMNAVPPQPTLGKKMLNEAVSQALPSNYDTLRNSVVSVGTYDLQLQASTPWFEAYRDTFFQVAFPSDHEFLKHFLGCIFVVSSSHADPMDQFAKLTQQQHMQQHQHPNKLPKWFCPNILRYYVLIHDVVEEEGAKAESVYQSMKATYGMNNCHLLQINAKSLHATDAPNAEHMPDPWSQFVKRKQDPNDLVDVDGSQLSATESEMFPSHVTEGRPHVTDGRPHVTDARPHVTDGLPQVNNVDGSVESAMEATEEPETQTSVVIDHPLAPDPSPMTLPSTRITGLSGSQSSLNSRGSPDNLIVRDSQNNPLRGSSTSLSGSLEKISRAAHYGSCLTLSDHDRLRIFIQEFLTRGLIPWAERMLRTLNDQVTTRKGIHRSFFSATKKWFAGNKPAGQTVMAEKTNVVYTPEAPEMQMRRLADLAFMFQLYDVAYQMYHTNKRDFNNDHAWLHYAGALEMACLAVYMQGLGGQRQYPNHYMESAINTYLNTCRAAQFATRATLLSTEALKSKDLYKDAAPQFIKMTSEDSDLRSALLLEQAAHCFIKMNPPMVRKYAFHMILAGHRFNKAGQRRHALRSYGQALQVYKGKHWSLAEDHINFTIGRQSFNLKQLDNAASACRHLLTAESKQSPLQQSAFLREYLYVHKQQQSTYSQDGATGVTSNGELPQLPLPVVEGDTIRVFCSASKQDSNEDGANGDVGTRQSHHVTDDSSDTWRKMEELILVTKYGQLPPGFRPSVDCHTKRTDNSLNPVTVLGESLAVEVELENPLKIPLILTDLVLLWRFVPRDFEDAEDSIQGQERAPPVITNEIADSAKCKFAGELIESQRVPEVLLQGNEKAKVHLSLTAHQTGELHITGLAYNLGSSAVTPTAGVPPQPQTPPLPPRGATTPSVLAGPAAGDGVKASLLAPSLSVRGKVTLEVQGPRLNGTKAEKASKMYGPDRRLDLVIVPRMPKLEVEFADFPKSMLCGEVRQVLVTLRNSGHHPLHTLKVACTCPEFFTFGKQDSASAQRGKDSNHIQDTSSVYRTLDTVSDSTVLEYPVAHEDVKFILDITLPGGKLDPGQTIRIPMWTRGFRTPGTRTLHFLFWYLSTRENPKLRHRVVQRAATITVHQSLGLRACAKRGDGMKKLPSASDDDRLKKLLVSLEVENMNNIQDSTIAEFNILQVSCVSCRWRLRHLTTDKQSDIKIGSRETMLMCFRGERCRHDPACDAPRPVFSNAAFDQTALDSAATPCRDFYFRSVEELSFAELDVETAKSSQHDVIVEPKVPPFSKLKRALRADLTLIVLWKAFLVDESGNSHFIMGQNDVTLVDLNTTVAAPPVTKLPLDQPPVRIIREPEEAEDPSPPKEVACQLLKFGLKHPKHVVHDFTSRTLCMVPIQISVYNCSQTTLDVVIETEKEADRHQVAPPEVESVEDSMQQSSEVIITTQPLNPLIPNPQPQGQPQSLSQSQPLSQGQSAMQPAVPQPVPPPQAPAPAPPAPPSTYPTQLYNDVPSASFRWVGPGSTRLTLGPDAARALPLTACFSKVGVYEVSRLTVRAAPSGADTAGLMLTAQKMASPCLIIIATSEETRS